MAISSSSAPPASSLYVKTAEARAEGLHLRRGKRVLTGDFSTSFLFTLSRFPTSHDNGPDSCPVNDAVLFEIGCYDYFLLDLWLFNNHRSVREAIATQVANDFVSLSTEVFGSDAIGETFDSRIANYAEIERSGVDDTLKKQMWYLKELILRARPGDMPQPYSCHGPIMITDIMKAFSIETTLAAWTTHMIPAMFKSISNLIELAAEDASGTEEGSGFNASVPPGRMQRRRDWKYAMLFLGYPALAWGTVRLLGLLPAGWGHGAVSAVLSCLGIVLLLYIGGSFTGRDDWASRITSLLWYVLFLCVPGVLAAWQVW